ncbi:ankyrin repeat protein [Diplodia corticola]|uniref:Ankyrin repeat protein n=1 Tax=Diplodia corticola TaxID=236234 RepID=A0A1J9S1Y4_9PEZI|nr:ankyrin repeat protein [Diplodia corticola]OJD38963.1 ankyrin repeat protein [Diplodia corticola]
MRQHRPTPRKADQEKKKKSTDKEPSSLRRSKHGPATRASTTRGAYIREPNDFLPPFANAKSHAPPQARHLADHSLALTAAIDALLHDKYQQHAATSKAATTALTHLSAQTTAIAASLFQLHALLLRDHGDHDDDDASTPAAAPRVDGALRATAFAFACLDAEVRRLSAVAAADPSPSPSPPSSGSGGASAAAQEGESNAPPPPPPTRSKWRLKKRMSMSTSTQAQRASLPEWRGEAVAGLLRQLGAVRGVLAGWVRGLLVVGEGEAREGPDGEAGLREGERALRAAWPGVEGPDLMLQAVGEEMGFVQAVVESPAYRAAVADRAAGKSEGGVDRADARAAEEVVVVEGVVEEAGGDGEHGPSCVAQAVPEVDGEVAGMGREDCGPSELREEGVASGAAPNKSQEGAASSGDARLEEDGDAPPLPPREQTTKEPDEEEAPPPPLPPRRPTALTPAVAPPSPTDNADENPAPPTHELDHTDDDHTPASAPDPPSAASEPSPSPPLHPHDLLIRHHWQTLLLTELRHITTLRTLLSTLRPAASSTTTTTTTTNTFLHTHHPHLLPHLDALLPHLSTLAALHARHLLAPLALQLASVVKSDLLLPVFRVWWRKAGGEVLAVARRVPHAVAAVRATMAAEGIEGEKFRRWVVELCGAEDGLVGVLESAVVGRVGEYVGVLGAVEGLEGEAGGEGGGVATRVGEYRRMMVRVREACEEVMREAEEAEGLRDVYRRIQTLDYRHVEALDMFGAERRMVWQGSLACRTKGKGLWNQVHCVLLDNYFFWGRVEQPREMWFGKYKYGEKLWVLEAVSVMIGGICVYMLIEGVADASPTARVFFRHYRERENEGLDPR